MMSKMTTTEKYFTTVKQVPVSRHASTPRREMLRAETLRRREQLPSGLRATLSQRIAFHVDEWMQTGSAASCAYTRVMVYLSMGSEVETIGLLEQLLRGGAQVCAPVVNMQRRQLIPRQICDVRTDLVRHSYGMLEPKEACPIVSPAQLQLVFVPGIAFDSRGYRLGYAKGFYDRFLPRCPNAVAVGLAYQVQLVADIFPQSWDVPVRRIFTENGQLIPRR